MRGIVSVLGIVAAIAIGATAAAAMKVAVPGGTAVPVRVDGSISSADANVGNTFTIKASDDVVVKGLIVIKNDAIGQGSIVSVDRAGPHGHQGSLGIRFDWLFATDGEKLQLANVNKNQTGESKKGASSTATIASTILLGPIGLFAHNFVHGKDVTLDGTHPLTAYVDHTAHVVSTEHAQGFAH